MKVFEIFESIQGESSYQGQPCLFIRLSGCNLRCSFCDTKETWDMKNGKDISIDQIIDRIKKSPVDLVEFTGGEPLLQSGEIGKVLFRMKEEEIDKKVLVETNGTITISLLSSQHRVVFILDVKPPDVLLGKFNEDNFKYMDEQNSELKFLVGTPEHIDFIYSFLEQYSRVIKTRFILISPMFNEHNKLVYSIDYNSLLLNLKKRFSFLNFRLNLQIHKFLGVK